MQAGERVEVVVTGRQLAGMLGAVGAAHASRAAVGDAWL